MPWELLVQSAVGQDTQPPEVLASQQAESPLRTWSEVLSARLLSKQCFSSSEKVLATQSHLNVLSYQPTVLTGTQ